ncbi:MAG: DUF6635 family protein [Geminicoccaceae bacterium]
MTAGCPVAETDGGVVSAYFAACRARIPAFTARHFRLAGTLRLHRHALGLDLLLAPLNVLLVAPAFALRLGALLCRVFGQRSLGTALARRELFVETRVSQRVADLVLNELLGAAETASVPQWRERARHLIAEYLSARNAVAELAAAVTAITVGLLLVHALTPSAISLGPLLARHMAQEEAIAGFWLGPWAGAIYFGWFPADASWARTICTTVVAMVCFALTATFIGLLTDPLQELCGVHRRRLNHFITVLERAALGDRDAVLALPDPYIARVTDLADMALMALRLTR